ncbi:MAG: alpha/beta hydrolase-fold protein [Promethearchaeota archaeon]
MANKTEKIQLIQSYLNDQRSKNNIPVIEERNCTFLFIGNHTTVLVAGDFNGWTGEPLLRINDTELWYLTKSFPLDARLDYKFVIDGTWTLDPENDQLIMGGYGNNNEIVMPNYHPDPAINHYDNITHGTIKLIRNFYSSAFENYRNIQVYLPPNYNPNSSKTYPSLYVTDGFEYVDLAKFANVFDYLLFHDLVREAIIIFIPPYPGERNNEYFYDKNTFLDFLTLEVLPYIDKNYRTSQNRSERGMMGASLGGYISFFVGFNRENLFGLIASQSGYFPYDLIFTLGSRVPDTKFYFDIGTFEKSIAGGTDLYTLNKEMNKTMTEKKYSFLYQEINEGHSWGNWRAHLDDILIYLLPHVDTPQNTSLSSNTNDLTSVTSSIISTPSSGSTENNITSHETSRITSYDTFNKKTNTVSSTQPTNQSTVFPFFLGILAIFVFYLFRRKRFNI